jgi:hypothetical protein
MQSVLSVRLFLMATCLATLQGCVTLKPYDYTAFKESKPKSILVLPPLNSTNDVRATYSLLSQTTTPLAEAGYYVFPVSLVDETFLENGLTQPNDIHAAPHAKLREIFGADAALYINVTKYGTTYNVIRSAAVVDAEAKLVDLRTGKLLWTQKATAASDEGQQSSGGLIGVLLTAVVNQIASAAFDKSHAVAGIASSRLLAPSAPQGVLRGPRSPSYGKDAN